MNEDDLKELKELAKKPLILRLIDRVSTTRSQSLFLERYRYLNWKRNSFGAYKAEIIRSALDFAISQDTEYKTLVKEGRVNLDGTTN
jgi:hypothetical protein